MKTPKWEKRVKQKLEKLHFYADFRENPINWVLIIFAVFLITIILIREIFLTPESRPRMGLALYFVNFIILIVIQGEWQKFRIDHNFLDSIAYLWFTFLVVIVYAGYGPINSVICAFLLILQIKYLVNRENRLATVMRKIGGKIKK